MGSHGELVHQIPRRADSDVICTDVGSACPHFIRVTANNFPQSRDEVVRPILADSLWCLYRVGQLCHYHVLSSLRCKVPVTSPSALVATRKGPSASCCSFCLIVVARMPSVNARYSWHSSLLGRVQASIVDRRHVCHPAVIRMNAVPPAMASNSRSTTVTLSLHTPSHRPPPSAHAQVAQPAVFVLSHVLRSVVQTQSHLPLAAIITPLAQGHPEEDPLPLIDCGPEGPTRCTRCRAYINPFVRFVDNDPSRTAFLCNLCGARGTMSEDRARQLQRPELELYVPTCSSHSAGVVTASGSHMTWLHTTRFGICM